MQTNSDLIEGGEATRDNNLKPITNWDEWFEGANDLPPIPELQGLTKRQRQKIIIECLIEKYRKQGLDL